MKKIFYALFCFLSTLIFANPLPMEPKLKINNLVLCKINGKTISVMDVKKKMDFILHSSFPDYANSKSAQYQFYTSSWKHVLKELINTQLMVSEAEAKEIKVNDGEIREEMEEKFGPNVLLTLENIGLTFDEAFDLVKTDMIVKRVMWYYVHSKALLKVTPEMIKQNYKSYCDKNPPFDEWEYQVISIKSNDELQAKQIADKAYALLSEEKDTKELQDQFPNAIQFSKFYSVNSKDISKSHKEILSALKVGAYSLPILQKSKDNKSNNKIFYLKNHSIKEPPAFEKMADKIKEDLLQEAAKEESIAYFSRLYKYYGIDDSNFKTDDVNPFVLE